MADDGEQCVGALLRDATLAPFLADHFDADEHTKQTLALASSAADVDTPTEDALRLLREKGAEIDAAVRACVRGSQNLLLQQADTTSALKRQLVSVEGDIRNLQSTTMRLAADVSAPVADLRKTAASMEGIVDALHLLRAVHQFVALSRRLRALLPGNGMADIVSGELLDPRALQRSAPLLRALLEHLEEHPALLGVGLVQAERAWLLQVQSALRDGAATLLRRSVESLNAADAELAARVLYDLGSAGVLAPAVLTLLDSLAGHASLAIQEALDVRLLSAAAAAGAGSIKPLQAASNAATADAAAPRLAVGPAALARDGPAALVLLGAAAGSVSRGAPPALAPPSGMGAAWRGALWGRLESALESATRSLLQAWNLAYVLVLAKVDGAGGDGQRHSLASAVVDAVLGARRAAAAAGGSGDDDSFVSTSTLAGPAGAVLLQRFWGSLTAVLHDEVAAVVASDLSVFVRNGLSEAYPRLHYTLQETLLRAARSVALRSAGEGTLIPDSEAAGLVASLHAVEPHRNASSGGGGGGSVGVLLLDAGASSGRLVWATAPLLRLYLARSLGRLMDPLHAMFPAAAASTGPSTGPAAGLAAPAAAAVPPATSTQPSLSPGQLAVNASFTPAAAVALFAEERLPSPPPTQAATAGFVRAMLAELAACRPPAAGATAAAAAASAQGGAAAHGHLEADASLYAAVARGLATAVKLLIAKAEACSAAGASAVAVSPAPALFCPTPAQLHNFALVARLDEVRMALLRAVAAAASATASGVSAEAVLPPSAFTVADEAEMALRSASGRGRAAGGGGGSADAVSAATLRRAALHPLGLALPHPLQVLLAVEDVAAAAAACGNENDYASVAPPETAAVCKRLQPACSVSAPGLLARALVNLDAAVESLVLPWLAAVAAPLELTVARLHEAGYGRSAALLDSGAAADVSEYAESLETMSSALANQQLAALPAAATDGPPGSTCSRQSLSEHVRATLACRVLSLFVRHACLIRSSSAALGDAGRARLARDVSAVEAAAISLLGPAAGPEAAEGGARVRSRLLGRAYAEFRALRPLLHTPIDELLAAADAARGHVERAAETAEATSRRGKIQTLLRTMRPHNMLHALLSRLPSDCALPFAATRMSPSQYSGWMDGEAAPACGAEHCGNIGAVRLWSSAVTAGSAGIDRAVLTRVQQCAEAFLSRRAATLAAAATPSADSADATALDQARWIRSRGELLLLEV